MTAAACLLAGCGSSAESGPVPAFPTFDIPPADARVAAVLLTAADVDPGWTASDPAPTHLPHCADGGVAGGTNLSRQDHLVLERAYVFPTEDAAKRLYRDWRSGKCVARSDGTRELKLARIGDRSAAYSYRPPGQVTGGHVGMLVLEGHVVIKVLVSPGAADELVAMASAADRVAHRSATG